jgi:hypothetical protein
MSAPKLKVGDNVRCIEPSDVGHVGIVGREYVVRECSIYTVEFEPTHEEAPHTGCLPSRFELVEPASPKTETATLRDQFAMAALTGLLSNLEGIATFEGCTAEAYLMADAMMAARARQ